MSFTGAKLAILTRGQVVTLLRDDKPGIPFPGHWDLPGGGRDGSETPETCVLRETREELGLILPETSLIWRRSYPSTTEPGLLGWFFICRNEAFDPDEVTFGDEGQGWRLMQIDEFRHHPRVVPYLADRLGDYLAETGSR